MKDFESKVLALLVYFIIFFIPSTILFGIQSLKTWAFCFIITAFIGTLNGIFEVLNDILVLLREKKNAKDESN